MSKPLLRTDMTKADAAAVYKLFASYTVGMTSRSTTPG
jgi:hypothetical protein